MREKGVGLDERRRRQRGEQGLELPKTGEREARKGRRKRTNDRLVSHEVGTKKRQRLRSELGHVGRTKPPHPGGASKRRNAEGARHASTSTSTRGPELPQSERKQNSTGSSYKPCCVFASRPHHTTPYHPGGSLSPTTRALALAIPGRKQAITILVLACRKQHCSPYTGTPHPTHTLDRHGGLTRTLQGGARRNLSMTTAAPRGTKHFWWMAAAAFFCLLAPPCEQPHAIAIAPRQHQFAWDVLTYEAALLA